jgi:hypothetical protein
VLAYPTKIDLIGEFRFVVPSAPIIPPLLEVGDHFGDHFSTVADLLFLAWHHLKMVDPHKAWALFMSDPVDFIVMFAAVAVASWALCSFIRKERVDTLKERVASLEDHLKFIREKYDNSQAEVQKLTLDTRRLEGDVDRLVAAMKAASQTTPVSVLSQLTAVRATSDLMTETVSSLSTTNDALGKALTTDPSPQIGLWKGNR